MSRAIAAIALLSLTSTARRVSAFDLGVSLLYQDGGFNNHFVGLVTNTGTNAPRTLDKL
jgi:hypothetical protein